MPPALQTTTRDSSFASTRWTVVHQAADSQTASQHSLSALSELCQIYWRPVYAFLRRQGIAQHDAQDLTQGSFADLIASRAYTRADPLKGRFRSFLLGALKRLMSLLDFLAGGMVVGLQISPIRAGLEEPSLDLVHGVHGRSIADLESEGNKPRD